MNKLNTKKTIAILVSIVLAAIIALTPPTGNLTVASMRFMGIFVGMLILFTTQVFEDWMIALLGACLWIITGVGSVGTVMAPFGQSTIWLVIGVTAMATGLGNSGIIRRISLKVLTKASNSYAGQVIALMASGLIISPLISSVLGKANLMLPLATSVTEESGLKARSRGALGLFTATFMTTYIIGNAFLSGSGNPGILLGYAPELSMGWLDWFKASFVWFIVMVIGTAIFCLVYCKPSKEDVMNLPEGYFVEKYKELGPMSKQEKQALIIIAVSLVAWVTQSIHKIDAGIIAVTATAILALLKILPTKDFIAKTPWTLIVFIGVLLSASTLMTSLGLSEWMAQLLGPILAPIVKSQALFIIILCIFVFLIRIVLVANYTTVAIALIIFGPLLQQTGISIYVLLFVTYMAANIWMLRHQNPLILSCVASAGNQYVTYAEFQKVSYVYMGLCIISFLISIPWWRMLGLIW